MSAAVTLGSSRSWNPMAGLALPILSDTIAPVRPASTPDNVNAMTIGLHSGTPAATASARPPPTA